MLEQTGLQPTPTIRTLYNKVTCDAFDDTRDFLALHYKLNTRLDNAFWRQCRNDTDMGALDSLLGFYRENGPTGLARHLLPAERNSAGIEGYLVMLVGNQAPYQARHIATPRERFIWEQNRATYMTQALGGVSVADALRIIRLPEWQWHG